MPHSRASLKALSSTLLFPPFSKQTVFVVKFLISVESFGDVLPLDLAGPGKVTLDPKTHLTIIEHSLDSDFMNVCISDHGHLGLLDERV